MKTVQEFSDGLAEFLDAKSDRKAVIFAFSMIEQFVGDLVKIKAKHSKQYEHLSVSVKICLLHELGEISDSEFESINWLRNQRNKAAHRPGYELDRSGIQKRWIMDLEGVDLRRNYLMTTVGGFWNKHHELREFYGLGKDA